MNPNAPHKWQRNYQGKMKELAGCREYREKSSRNSGSCAQEARHFFSITSGQTNSPELRVSIEGIGQLGKLSNWVNWKTSELSRPFFKLSDFSIPQFPNRAYPVFLNPAAMPLIVAPKT